MDWLNVEPDKYNLLDRHYTPGRGGASVEFITLHHMAMIGDVDDCVRVWQERQASAHYAISPTGMIGQAVNDSDTAWSNANLYSNQRSISIEHSNSAGPDQDWPISEATREAGAHLVAALCRYYKLGRPASGRNVRFHSVESGGATACPYHLRPGQKYHDTYIQRAQYWYDQMTGAKPVAQKVKAPAAAKPTVSAPLTVKYFTDFMKGFIGPVISDVKDIRQQLTGGRDAGQYGGWSVSQLVKNFEAKPGDRGTVPEMLAVALTQLDELRRDVDELKGKK